MDGIDCLNIVVVLLCLPIVVIRYYYYFSIPPLPLFELFVCSSLVAATDKNDDLSLLLCQSLLQYDITPWVAL